MSRVGIVVGLLLAVTACGSEVGALSDPVPEPTRMEQSPELECRGGYVSGHGTYALPLPKQPPVSPREAMIERLRGNVAGITVDGLVEYRSSRGRGFFYEVEDRILGIFRLVHLGDDVWVIGGETHCSEPEAEALRSARHVSCEGDVYRHEGDPAAFPGRAESAADAVDGLLTSRGASVGFEDLEDLSESTWQGLYTLVREGRTVLAVHARAGRRSPPGRWRVTSVTGCGRWAAELLGPAGA